MTSTDSFNLGKAFRSAWHNLTSYDRHADVDSPYRTGNHVPLSQSRHEPLTSVATTASESRADVSSPYFEESGSRGSMSALNGGGYPNSPVYARGNNGSNSPTPYSPGMRSAQASQQTANDTFSESAAPGEIQLQAFQEGLPPAPPCSHSWRQIDRWAEEYYEELFDQLCEGCTANDLNELEHQLDCSLPLEVRESMQHHDGQEQGGRPTGIIFGCMLLDCEEIVHEWHNWKVVNQEYLTEPVNYKPSTPVKALGGSSSAASSSKHQQTQNPMWRQDLLARQDSQPPGAIQKVYAHPAWIPLARDWGGNNLAVDLAPGPTGKWGQVILFGRDYDCKYVVARSWSAFLATVADDMKSGKWFVDENTDELKLREFKTSKVEPGYLDILRWRADQKYGRRGPRRRGPPPNGASNANGSPNGSPYASPAADVNVEPRGRSMQRFSGATPVASPNRPNYPKSSPLSKVAEETPAPAAIKTDVSDLNGKLVEIGTPRASDEAKRSKVMSTLLDQVTLDDDKENVKLDGTPSRDSKSEIKEIKFSNGNVDKQAMVEDESAMKTIEI